MKDTSTSKKSNNANRVEFRGNASQIALMNIKLASMGVKPAKFFNKCIQDFVNGDLIYTPDSLKRVNKDE